MQAKSSCLRLVTEEEVGGLSAPVVIGWLYDNRIEICLIWHSAKTCVSKPCIPSGILTEFHTCKNTFYKDVIFLIYQSFEEAPAPTLLQAKSRRQLVFLRIVV